jgi:hypothetical protein
VGEASGVLDDAVVGFGAAVVDSAGGEVGQDLRWPLPQCSAEPGEFGDRARECRTAMSCSATRRPASWCARVIDRPGVVGRPARPGVPRRWASPAGRSLALLEAGLLFAGEVPARLESGWLIDMIFNALYLQGRLAHTAAHAADTHTGQKGDHS